MLKAAPNTVLMLYPFGPAWTNSYPAGSLVRGLLQRRARGRGDGREPAGPASADGLA